MKEKIEAFITNNTLTFEKGNRNTDITIICGYTQFLGEEEDVEVKPILEEILEPYFKKDAELRPEFERVWDYTDYNDYYLWWRVDTNAELYVM